MHADCLICISLAIWKKGIKDFVEGRGLERNAPEASVGFSLGHEDKSLFPPEEAGGSCPPHMRRNQRLMIPSVPVWPPAPGGPCPIQHTFFQRAKVLPVFFISILSIRVYLCPIRIFYAFKRLGLQTVLVDDKIFSACKRKPWE